jgi:hypothetical protein
LPKIVLNSPVAGPVETERVTTDPSATVVPGAGVCATTTPGAKVLLDSDVIETVRPSAPRVLPARGGVSPIRLGITTVLAAFTVLLGVDDRAVLGGGDACLECAVHDAIVIPQATRAAAAVTRLVVTV